MGVLGRGGMGVVYKARQKGLNRLVALKMILSGTHAGPEDLARFRIEAEAVAKLQHPNIVQIYDWGDDLDGHPFFSLEYLDGGSLATKLDGTPMDVNKAAELVATLARAMNYAHQQSIVHRDLKPANVLLTSDGKPKITDFGLAKKLGTESNQTGTGAILGTPSYMAPEQAQGRTREIGPAADIYSLGAILYDAITGRPPFRGETVLDTLQQVQSAEPVAPTRLRPKIPADLETICLKCLRKEPAKRYASAAHLAEDLERFLAGRPILARPVSLWERGVKWARRRPGVAALLITLALVLTVGFFAMAGLWMRAENLRKEAEHESELAKAAEKKEKEAKKLAQQHYEDSLRNLYAVSMSQAQSAWREAKLGRLFDLLESQKPERTGGLNLRGFEWNFLHRLYSSDSLALKAHIQHVNHVAFRPPDGRQLASAGVDGTIVLWDPEATSGPEYHILRGHTKAVRKLAFSADGKQLASGGEDNLVLVWNLEEKDPRPRAFKGHHDFISGVAFSPDGKRLASGSEDQSVKIWDLASGKEQSNFTGHDYGVTDVAFSPDGKQVASSSLDHKVIVWDLETAKDILTLEGHKHWVMTVAFSPDGKRLASADWDRVVKVWDAASGKQVLNLEGHDNPVRGLAFSPDSQRLASVCFDQTVTVWDLTTSKIIRTFPGGNGLLRSVAFSADGQLLASVNFSPQGKQGVALTGSGGSLLGVAFGRDGNILAAPSTEGNILIYDLADKNYPHRDLKGHVGPVRALAFDFTGKNLASAGDDGSVRIWNHADGKLLQTLEGHKRWVTAVAYSPKGRWLASGSLDQMVRLWDLEDGGKSRSLKGHGGTIHAVAFSPDGKLLASGGTDQTIKIWNVNGEEILSFKEKHEGAVMGLAFSPNGKTLASAGWDMVLKLWDVDTGKVLRTFKGHTNGVNSVVFSSDGMRLVSGSADGTAKVWDVATGQETLTLKGHTQGVTGVALSPDGLRLASSSWDRTILLWDAGK